MSKSTTIYYISKCYHGTFAFGVKYIKYNLAKKSIDHRVKIPKRGRLSEKQIQKIINRIGNPNNWTVYPIKNESQLLSTMKRTCSDIKIMRLINLYEYIN